MGDALLVHAPSSPDPIPTRLAYFPPQIGGENKVMVELGERMLLVAILGTVYPSTPSCCLLYTSDAADE